MIGRIRTHASYANVAATLALFIALGGTSYAVAGSIGSRAIENNSLRGVDIRNRTIKERDIASGSLGTRVIAERRLSRVPLASRARRVDCASGTRIAGGCVSHRLRAADSPFGAARECALNDARLPTAEELLHFALNFNGVLGTATELTGTVLSASPAQHLTVVAVDMNRSEVKPTDGPAPFRCVRATGQDVSPVVPD